MKPNGILRITGSKQRGDEYMGVVDGKAGDFGAFVQIIRRNLRALLGKRDG